ncbi:hypothetical protein BGZ60DRAFT_407499 [Tricladium varicosporioides]|nr:hypothetical protein BGZ60DRAFT_407499 [Hymenoscyphus varicosporioides]
MYLSVFPFGHPHRHSQSFYFSICESRVLFNFFPTSQSASLPICQSLFGILPFSMAPNLSPVFVERAAATTASWVFGSDADGNSYVTTYKINWPLLIGIIVFWVLFLIGILTFYIVRLKKIRRTARQGTKIMDVGGSYDEIRPLDAPGRGLDHDDPYPRPLEVHSMGGAGLAFKPPPPPTAIAQQIPPPYQGGVQAPLMAGGYANEPMQGHRGEPADFYKHQ